MSTTGIGAALAGLLGVLTEWVRRRWRKADTNEVEIRELKYALALALSEGRVTDAAYISRRLDKLGALTTHGKQV